MTLPLLLLLFRLANDYYDYFTIFFCRFSLFFWEQYESEIYAIKIHCQHQIEYFLPTSASYSRAAIAVCLEISFIFIVRLLFLLLHYEPCERQRHFCCREEHCSCISILPPDSSRTLLFSALLYMPSINHSSHFLPHYKLH